MPRIEGVLSDIEKNEDFQLAICSHAMSEKISSILGKAFLLGFLFLFIWLRPNQFLWLICTLMPLGMPVEVPAKISKSRVSPLIEHRNKN